MDAVMHMRRRMPMPTFSALAGGPVPGDRVFLVRERAGTDVAFAPGARLIEIQAHGADMSVRIGADGLESMTAPELDERVQRFRDGGERE